MNIKWLRTITLYTTQTAIQAYRPTCTSTTYLLAPVCMLAGKAGKHQETFGFVFMKK